MPIPAPGREAPDDVFLLAVCRALPAGFRRVGFTAAPAASQTKLAGPRCTRSSGPEAGGLLFPRSTKPAGRSPTARIFTGPPLASRVSGRPSAPVSCPAWVALVTSQPRSCRRRSPLRPRALTEPGFAGVPPPFRGFDPPQAAGAASSSAFTELMARSKATAPVGSLRGPRCPCFTGRLPAGQIHFEVDLQGKALISLPARRPLLLARSPKGGCNDLVNFK